MDANILYEDDDVLVMLDAFPDVTGHTLVIPKKHYEDIYELPDEVFNKITKVGKVYASRLIEKLNRDSVSFLVNCGEAQVIKHFHMHILPKNSKKLTNEEVYKIMKED